MWAGKHACADASRVSAKMRMLRWRRPLPIFGLGALCGSSFCLTALVQSSPGPEEVTELLLEPAGGISLCPKVVSLPLRR